MKRATGHDIQDMKTKVEEFKDCDLGYSLYKDYHGKSKNNTMVKESKEYNINYSLYKDYHGKSKNNTKVENSKDYNLGYSFYENFHGQSKNNTMVNFHGQSKNNTMVGESEDCNLDYSFYEDFHAQSELMNMELQLELDMVENGKEAFLRTIERARERGEESTTPYGRRLIQGLIEPMTKAINDFIAESDTGMAGRRHTALRFVKAVEPEVLAYLTLKTVLDGITRRERASRVALRVADSIMDELRMRKLREENPAQFKFVRGKLEKEHHLGRMRTLARYYANRAGVEVDWDLKTKVRVGMKLLDLLRVSTGLIEFQHVPVKLHQTELYAVPTAEAMDWINQLTDDMSILSPAYVPMVVPPKPWRGVYGGGYWSEAVRPIPLVKSNNKQYLEELDNRNIEAVFAAVNAMQNTPWRVNRKVLAVAEEAWEKNIQAGKLRIPNRDMEELPPRPADIDTNDEARRSWRRRAAKVYDRNMRLKSKRTQFRKILYIAKEFAKWERIYFPYQLDFRGRAYAIPMFLNPQGPDIAKGLLTFADGKPIEDETAAGWLAIHGANSYGQDKLSFSDRIAWVKEHQEQIMSVARDPFGKDFEWWINADSPWQFLAFAFEWAEFTEQGYGYVSSLPIAMDGSCNGLQHYSAALRDPVGGEATNLVPSPVPNDIYKRVAEVVEGYITALLRPDSPLFVAIPEGVVTTLPFDMAKLMRIWREQEIDPVDMCHKWLAWGIDRGLTKRSVMTLPYGSTQYSCREFLEEYVQERIEEGKPNVFAVNEEDNGIFKATLWLQPLVWAAIGEVVHAARVGMDWLKTCARLAASEGIPATWETPDGFLVQQFYYDATVQRVNTMLEGGVRVRLNLLKDTSQLDRRRQQQGIAPNWVHSMDATALRMYVNMAREHGIKHFALVHDSYGTVAADVETMGRCLRQAFIDLYTQHDPLEMFRVDMLMMLSEENAKQLPPVPEKGTLDLSLVAESDFFFA